MLERKSRSFVQILPLCKKSLHESRKAPVASLVANTTGAATTDSSHNPATGRHTRLHIAGRYISIAAPIVHGSMDGSSSKRDRIDHTYGVHHAVVYATKVRPVATSYHRALEVRYEIITSRGRSDPGRHSAVYDMTEPSQLISSHPHRDIHHFPSRTLNGALVHTISHVAAPGDPPMGGRTRHAVANPTEHISYRQHSTFLDRAFPSCAPLHLPPSHETGTRMHG
jgi:hypothetical protein